MTLSTDAIKTGDFLVIGFGNGTQGVKVIGTTAKRLEIIRCQQYLSEFPFWTGAISKISRSDERIRGEWQVPASVAADAPSDEEIAETKAFAKARAACSKLVNQAVKPFEVARDEWYESHYKPGFAMSAEEKTEFTAKDRELHAAMNAAGEAAAAEFVAKSGESWAYEYGSLVKEGKRE
tara:strand:+ start:171 stop:707 length:537 start_codon:yes stop_codon:yes gene_type:complete